MKTICCVLLALILTGTVYSAQYEPAHGIYLGVFIPSESTADFLNFNTCAGKQHAVYATYIMTDLSFPWNWVTAVTSACPNAALHIAYEAFNGFPETFNNWNSGQAMYDRIYTFATNCALFNGPIFLRFGHEANGTWYPWCPGYSESDLVTTQTYIQGWRNVADLFHSVASNVVMVWAPTQGTGQLPLCDYASIYPGDNWVDWVGLSCYNGAYYGNHDHILDYQLKKAIESGYYQDDADPSNDTLQNFYDTFSNPDNPDGHHKPMMVAETSSHFAPFYAYSNQQGVAAFESLTGAAPGGDTLVESFESLEGMWSPWIHLQYSISGDSHSGTGAIRLSADNEFSNEYYVGGTGTNVANLSNWSSVTSLYICIKRESGSADNPKLGIGIRSDYGSNEKMAVWPRVITSTNYIRYDLPRSEVSGAYPDLDWTKITALTLEMHATNTTHTPADVIVDDFGYMSPAGEQVDQNWWNPWGLNKWELTTDAQQGQYALCFGGSRTNEDDYIGGNGCSFDETKDFSEYDGITFYAKRGTNSLICPWVKLSIDSSHIDTSGTAAELTFCVQNTTYSLYTLTFPMFDTGNLFNISNVVRMKLELITLSDNEDIADVYMDDLRLTQCSVTNYDDALQNQHGWMQQLFSLDTFSDTDPADPDSHPDYIDVSYAFENLHMVTWFHNKKIEDGSYINFEILSDGTGDIQYETYNQFISNSYFMSSVVIDQDSDGMDDAWENTWFGSTATQPDDDSDNDGMTNVDEYLAQTDPTDTASVFSLKQSLETTAGDNTIAFSWNSLPGLFYRLEYAETLSGPFAVITNGIKSNPPQNILPHALTNAAEHLYFRIIQE